MEGVKGLGPTTLTAADGSDASYRVNHVALYTDLLQPNRIADGDGGGVAGFGGEGSGCVLRGDSLGKGAARQAGNPRAVVALVVAGAVEQLHALVAVDEAPGERPRHLR